MHEPWPATGRPSRQPHRPGGSPRAPAGATARDRSIPAAHRDRRGGAGRRRARVAERGCRPSAWRRLTRHAPQSTNPPLLHRLSIEGKSGAEEQTHTAAVLPLPHLLLMGERIQCCPAPAFLLRYQGRSEANARAARSRGMVLGLRCSRRRTTTSPWCFAPTPFLWKGVRADVALHAWLYLPLRYERGSRGVALPCTRTRRAETSKSHAPADCR